MPYNQYGNVTPPSSGYGNLGTLLSNWLSQVSNPTQTQSFNFLMNLAQGGGSAADALRTGVGGAPSFWNQQLGAEDPIGNVGEARGFAKKVYGPASTGIGQAYNDSMRMMRESQGGLNTGGVNPRAEGYAKAFFGAKKAGDLGTLWGNLQGMETDKVIGALESTADYRKGISDSLTNYGTALAGASSQDDQFTGNILSQLLASETGQQNQALQFLTALLGPLLQRQTFRQGGLNNQAVADFISSLLGS